MTDQPADIILPSVNGKGEVAASIEEAPPPREEVMTPEVARRLLTHGTKDGDVLMFKHEESCPFVKGVFPDSQNPGVERLLKSALAGMEANLPNILCPGNGLIKCGQHFRFSMEPLKSEDDPFKEIRLVTSSVGFDLKKIETIAGISYETAKHRLQRGDIALGAV